MEEKKCHPFRCFSLIIIKNLQWRLQGWFQPKSTVPARFHRPCKNPSSSVSAPVIPYFKLTLFRLEQFIRVQPVKGIFYIWKFCVLPFPSVTDVSRKRECNAPLRIRTPRPDSGIWSRGAKWGKQVQLSSNSLLTAKQTYKGKGSGHDQNKESKTIVSIPTLSQHLS